MKINLLIVFLLLQISGIEGYGQLNIHLSEYASGFSQPVDISNAGDARLFIVERAGRIEILDSIGSVLPTPFLNIVSKVNSGSSEQGLLGLAFHPNYSSNGYFFVNYINSGGSTIIARFNVDSLDKNLADPQSEVQIMAISQPFPNHNGGELNFGQDGYLYIGMGDGGSGGDPGDRAQDSTNFLGKMLRIDIDSSLPYTIPASNPFLGMPGVLEEIWAIGLRNPWRFSFDRATGDMWIGDVGQNSWEEIDLQDFSSTGGENYGWRCFEGTNTFNSSGCLAVSNYTPPLHQYPNTGFIGDCSVTGGYVYRGSQYPNMVGNYFYGDYCSSKIWTLKDSGSSWINEFQGSFPVNGLSTFGEDNTGELYAAGLSDGKIYHIIDSTITVGISNPSNSFDPHVFPNPFNSELSISLELVDSDNKKVLASIWEMAGNKVFEKSIKVGQTKLDLGFLKSGIYILSLSSKVKSKRYKIIKE